jgi:hypothetical protein
MSLTAHDSVTGRTAEFDKESALQIAVFEEKTIAGLKIFRLAVTQSR